MLLFILSISKTMAGFYSLLLPGSGDILLGNKERGKTFLISEATVWTGYIVFTLLGNDTKNDYINFAHLRAGSNPARKDEMYLNVMEWYRSIYEYNEYIEEYARYLYPDSIEKRKEYIDNNTLSETYYWEWQNNSDLSEYVRLRKKSRGYMNTARNIASLAIVNRIVSFVLTSYFSKDVSLIFKPNGVEVVWRIK